MRSEFLGACARFPGLAEAVNASQYLLPRMAHEDLMRAIREPAALYGGEVTRQLAERLIADAGGGQDQLPLIQHGLMLIHRDQVTRRGISHVDSVMDADRGGAGSAWRLGLEHYDHQAGLTGLLSNHADAVKEEAEQKHLPPGQPGRVVEDMFRALSDINADGQAIRRQLTFDKLRAVINTDETALRGIIDTFRADGVSFLKPYGDKPMADYELIEVSHEALIRCWKEIADKGDGWLIREFRSGLVWRSLLVQAQDFEKDPANVLSPATTDEREHWLLRCNKDWAGRYGGGWERVRRLMEASIAARAKEKRWKDAYYYWKFLLGVLVVLVALLGFAGTQLDRVRRAHDEVSQLLSVKEAALAVAAKAQLDTEAAQKRSEALAWEASELAETLKRNVADLAEKAAKSASGTVTVSKSTLMDAKTDIEKEAVKFQNAVSSSPTDGSSTPPVTAGRKPRVYFFIADKRQAETAHALEQKLEDQTLAGSAIIVPSITEVKTPTMRSELRCFRADDCGADGEELRGVINRLLNTPKVELVNLGERYGNRVIPRHHYELWFAPGEIKL